MPENSQHKSPWQLAVEQLIGVFFTAMLIALGLDDPGARMSLRRAQIYRRNLPVHVGLQNFN